jgi:hypothetical protein
VVATLRLQIGARASVPCRMLMCEHNGVCRYMCTFDSCRLWLCCCKLCVLLQYHLPACKQQMLAQQGPAWCSTCGCDHDVMHMHG